MRGKVKELMTEMLKKRLIRLMKSPWASLIVLVAKIDGSTRFCVDYRKLNAVTKPDVYKIDGYLDQLQGAKYFSTLLAFGRWRWT